MTHRFTVDYPEDLALRARGLRGAAPARASRPSRWRTSSHFLDGRPDIFALNRHLAGVNWYRHHLAELRTVSRRRDRVREDAGGHDANAADVGPTPTCEARAPWRVREHIVRMSAGGGCFIGASLSCADLLVYLYERVLRLSPGHAWPIPTATTSSSPRGTTCPRSTARWPSWATSTARASTATSIPERPHLLAPQPRTSRASSSTPARSATCCRWRSASPSTSSCAGSGNRVFVLLGDGELDEGSVWEAAAGGRAPSGSTTWWRIVDRNEFQANIETEELIPLEPLADKFRAFGFARPHHRRPRLPGAGQRRSRDLPARDRAAHARSSPAPCGARACPASSAGPTAGSPASPADEVEVLLARAARRRRARRCTSETLVVR